MAAQSQFGNKRLQAIFDMNKNMPKIAEQFLFTGKQINIHENISVARYSEFRKKSTIAEHSQFKKNKSVTWIKTCQKQQNTLSF